MPTAARPVARAGSTSAEDSPLARLLNGHADRLRKSAKNLRVAAEKAREQGVPGFDEEHFRGVLRRLGEAQPTDEEAAEEW